MFGIGKSESKPAPRLIELTDDEGFPVLIETEAIISVHMYRGTTHVNTRDPITHKNMFFRVAESPSYIKDFMSSK